MNALGFSASGLRFLLLFLVALTATASACNAALVVTPPETQKDERYTSWKADTDVKFELIGVGTCAIYSDLAASTISVDLAKETSISIGKVKDTPGIFLLRITHEYELEGRSKRDKYIWTVISMPLDAKAKTFALEIRSDAVKQSASSPMMRSPIWLESFMTTLKDKDIRERAFKSAWSTYLSENKDALAITAGTCATGVLTGGQGFFVGLCLERTVDSVAELAFLFLKNCVEEMRTLRKSENKDTGLCDTLDKVLDEVKATWDMTNALKMLKKTANAGDAIEKAEFLKDFFMGTGAFDTTDKDSGMTISITLETTEDTKGDGKATAGYQLRWKLSKSK